MALTPDQKARALPALRAYFPQEEQGLDRRSYDELADRLLKETVAHITMDFERERAIEAINVPGF